MDTKEQWRAVTRNSLYEVSSLGRVRRITYLKDFLDDSGYPTVQMYAHQRKTTVDVHRLVAEAFLPNPEHLPQVNHKDGNKLNRSVENLEWVTGPENMKHARKLGLILHPSTKGPGWKRAELTEAEIAEIRSLRGTLSQPEIALRFGIHRQTVNRIQLGRHWIRTHKEFAAKGSDAGLAKLTDIQVRCIRALGKLPHPRLRSRRGGFRLRSLWRQEAIAEHFGVSRSAIRNILDGVTWRHVT